MPKENEGLSAEKVAESLNASTAAKESADKAHAETVEVKSTMQELSGSIKDLVKGLVEKKSEEDSDAIKELKSEVALLTAKSVASNQGSQGGSNPAKELEVKSLNTVKAFASATKGKTTVSFGEQKSEKSVYGTCGILEQKSLRTFDNADAGAYVPATKILGNIDINLQTINPVTSVVNNVNAGAIVAQELGYSTFDDSLIDIYESGEGSGADETALIKNGTINIHVTKNSAKFPISDKTLLAAESGELTANPIIKTLNSIEKRYEKKIARKILNGTVGMGVNGIFLKAQESASRIEVIESATDDKVTLADLSVLCSRLKGAYLRNAVILIDRACLYELYLEEGNDGHLKIEQFDYANGLAALRTPERVIPLIGVDSSYKVADLSKNDGFAGYTPFSGSVTAANLAGYTPSQLSGETGATDNEGKVAAVLADFSEGYSLARSSVVRVGYDQSFGNLLQDGFVLGGKIGFVGGDVTNQEAIAILTVK